MNTKYVSNFEVSIWEEYVWFFVVELAKAVALNYTVPNAGWGTGVAVLLSDEIIYVT